MRQRLSAARRNEDGFTLTELLIVIVILGILAGIVVFAVNGITDKGRVTACKAEVRTVEVAAEAFFAQNNAWADDMPELVAAGLLKNAPDPNNPHYRIIYNSSNGAVIGRMGDGFSLNCLTGQP